MTFSEDYFNRNNNNPIIGKINNVGSGGGGALDVTSIETGRVGLVNQDYTCMVYTDNGKHIDKVIPVTPWFNYQTGAGVFACPEVGARVVVSKSMSGEWFILGYAPERDVDNQDDCSNNRRELGQGDVCISTASGNYMEIRKYANSISLSNTPECAVTLEGRENRVYVYSQRMVVDTKAGQVVMTINAENKATAASGYFRKNLDDKENFVKFMLGSVSMYNEADRSLSKSASEDKEDIIFDLNISNKVLLSVDTKGNIKFNCNSINGSVVEDFISEIGKTLSQTVKGDMDVNVSGDLSTEASGNLSQTAKGDMDIVVKGDLKAEASGNFTEKAGGEHLRDASSIYDKAGIINHGR